MVRIVGILSLIVLLFTANACNPRKRGVSHLLQEWHGKEIFFPENSIFTICGKDTVAYNCNPAYKIVSYVDSIGCINCKLGLDKWAYFNDLLDSVAKNKFVLLFYLHPKDIIDLKLTLRKYKFMIPVCIDVDDNFNKLNHFPSDMAFQTFLLNKNNKVVAIGNPVHNPKVKELYLKIIKGDTAGQKDENKAIKTKVYIDKTSAALGDFDWQQEQKAVFILKNAGNKPLLIEGVSTSCGCTSVAYSKEPVQPGKDMALEVTYKADRPEHFSKTITVYCNAETSPVVLKISGDAK